MLRSFPRKRESRAKYAKPSMSPWVPAFAGTSGIDINSISPGRALAATLSAAFILLDTNNLRCTGNHPVPLHRRQRPAHGILGRRIGDQDHRNRAGRLVGTVAAVRARPRVTLQDRFQRNLLLG